MARRTILALCALLSMLGGGAWAADIHDVRLWRAPDHTRIVLDLTGPVEHQVATLKNPERVVLDIRGVRLRTDFSQLKLKGSPVQRIRHAPRDGDGLRVVFDLDDEVKPRSFMLGANESYGERLVIDLMDRNARPVVAKRVQSEKRRDIVIAIDAGHGGDDPGAVGPGNLYEKHVVLAIAQELHRLLEKEPGFRPVLIRKGDYYVGLKQRRDLARKAQADLMISIHADAFTSPRAHGGSVYALSHSGATSAMAAFLAVSENSTDAIGGVMIEGKDNDLVRILTDLSMTASLEASMRIGGHILQDMAEVTHLHSRRVEQAAFAVLKAPDIPSILVETGFISNPEEARRLATRAHQQRLARAIFSGIHRHFNESPPPDTHLAWLRSNGRSREYRIVRGDTLSEIARRHQVSVVALREHNGLQDNRIRVGQTLKIP